MHISGSAGINSSSAFSQLAFNLMEQTEAATMNIVLWNCHCSCKGGGLWCGNMWCVDV